MKKEKYRNLLKLPNGAHRFFDRHSLKILTPGPSLPGVNYRLISKTANINFKDPLTDPETFCYSNILLFMLNFFVQKSC